MSKLPILLYHDLEAEDVPNEKLNLASKNTVVRKEAFENQIRYFVDHKYRTITLGEYFRYIKENQPVPPNRMIITFDDGHYSNYELAFPILRKYHLQATFFIITDRIGQKYHLTADQIAEMDENGMEIGSHGASHQYLPLLAPEEIEAEIRESKKVLQKLLQKSVVFFAFPGGHYNNNALMALKNNSYTGACSCIQGLNTNHPNPWLLKRIEIRRNVTAEELTHLFNPLNIAIYQLLDSTKSILRRTVGLKLYSKIRANYSKYYIFKR